MATRHFAVIGSPINHSLSPIMHNAAFQALGLDADYCPIHVPDNGVALRDFVEQSRFELSGFNVTVPHKQRIVQCIDELSPVGAMTGSINTVAVRDGRIFGTSTDGIGFELAVRDAFHYDLKDGAVALIGAGGAARAVAFQSVMQGVRRLTIINRTENHALALRDELLRHYSGMDVSCVVSSEFDAVARELSQSELAVQCTSLGLRHDDPDPLPLDVFPPDILFFDAIYSDTHLQSALRGRGNPVSNGLGMLLYQGVESFRFWFPGIEPPVEIMRNALEKAVKSKR